MADDDAQVIGLLAKLADDDPEAAREALAALDWITGEQDLTVLTQERLQTFLWYELPSKWMTEPEDKVMITASLARALDLVDLPRYAEICRSATTTEVLEAYQRGYDEGRLAFRRDSAAPRRKQPSSDYRDGPVASEKPMRSRPLSLVSHCTIFAGFESDGRNVGTQRRGIR